MFHMSSMKMGLDQAVLQGIENSGGKEIMTKEEVEKLLKHGAYDIFKEDQDGTSEKESNDFVSQDIDSILARRAKTGETLRTGGCFLLCDDCFESREEMLTPCLLALLAYSQSGT